MPQPDTIKRIGELIAALDNSEFPDLLSTHLNAISSFDFLGVFRYERHQEPAYLFGNLTSIVSTRPLSIFVGDTFRHHPFFQHQARGLADGVHALRELNSARFVVKPQTESPNFVLDPREEIGYRTSDFPAALSELDLSIRVTPTCTLQMGLYRETRKAFSRADRNGLSAHFPVVRSLLTKYLANIQDSEPASAESLYAQSAERFGDLLSPRELQIASLVIAGHSSAEIARQLSISHETVKSHRKRVYEKLDINSAPELSLLLLRHRQAS